MRLDALLPQADLSRGSRRSAELPLPEITDLTLDSREVRPGAAFLACRGGSQHGLDHIDQALARGASVVLWEPAEGRTEPALPSDVLAVCVPDLAARASEIAARFFGHPSQALRVVGITGTNGKTTCAWLLAQALEQTGHPAAYIGTLGAGRNGHVVAGSHTTPDAVTLQRLLAGFRAEGATHVAMEVSSHALVQKRAAAVRFAAAVLTNLTRDHLDYHGTMAHYAEAKALLFTHADLAVRIVNADDAFGRELLARHPRAIGFSPSGAPAVGGEHPWLRAIDVRLGDAGLSFQLESSFGDARVESALIGGFNLSNALTVLGAMLGLGLPLAEATGALRTLAPPPGRMERFGGGAAPLVAVDYAHTPDALEKALQALRGHTAGKLWCVFGCGGDRDRGKRPAMGEIAARLADEVIVTDDNPRTETPDAIVRDILAGVGAVPVTVEHDRARAIARAVQAARAGDAVLIAGKGHESVQIVGREQRPFSDAAAVCEALDARAA